MLWLNSNKKQPITQIWRPHYPIWVIYPQVGNQCNARSSLYFSGQRIASKRRRSPVSAFEWWTYFDAALRRTEVSAAEQTPVGGAPSVVPRFAAGGRCPAAGRRRTGADGAVPGRAAEFGSHPGMCPARRRSPIGLYLRQNHTHTLTHGNALQQNSTLCKTLPQGIF